MMLDDSPTQKTKVLRHENWGGAVERYPGRFKTGAVPLASPVPAP